VSDLPLILDTLRRSSGRPAVLATLMRVSGSAYRGPGARMLVLEGGSAVGALSGGCLEKDVISHAERVARSGVPEVVTYDLTAEDEEPWGLNMGCAAVLDVLLEPVRGVPEHLTFIAESHGRRESAVVATLFKTSDPAGPSVGARLLVSSDGKFRGSLTEGALGGSVRTDAQRVLREERSDVVAYPVGGATAEVLVEFLPQPVRLVLCGGGTDVEPLRRIGEELGWEVAVVGRDDPLGVLDDRTAAVVMSHNYGRDLARLEQLVSSKARYIGLLGPRSRTERLLSDVAAHGVALSPVVRSRLFAPVGLDIGAETPAEIAVAIAAEIRAVLASRPGGRLRDRPGPIHDRR
jgi:xanthine/CO dehydrogenase XdhC/CoxF family maturation factor